jgi:hypothetical protein
MRETWVPFPAWQKEKKMTEEEFGDQWLDSKQG